MVEVMEVKNILMKDPITSLTFPAKVSHKLSLSGSDLLSYADTVWVISACLPN